MRHSKFIFLFGVAIIFSGCTLNTENNKMAQPVVIDSKIQIWNKQFVPIKNAVDANFVVEQGSERTWGRKT